MVQMTKNNNKILIGKIVAPQGLRGEVRVQTYTEKPTDFQKLAVSNEQLEIKFVRAVPSSDVIIAKVTGVDDRNAAESLRGTELFIDRASLPALESGEYYQADLVGMTVIQNGITIGIVDSVQNFGAGDILELDNGDMISFNGASVDMANKTITVK